MNSREMITEAAENAGWINRSSEDQKRYWGIDEWYMPVGRKTLRVQYDNIGRIRAAVRGDYKETKIFLAPRVAGKVLAHIEQEEEKRNGRVRK